MGFGKKRSNKVGVGAITTNKKKLFAEGGMMDDGKDVDPVSGNDVPLGSLAEEVRDDVDAKLSPGEFVIPADVVRFIGLERLMKMRDEAKAGLARMNDIGQMGNAEEVGEKANDAYEGEDEEDDGFESEIDDIMKEVDREETGRQTEMAFNTGGFVNPSYYDLTKAPKNPALDIRYFTDNQGKTFYMPFVNGKPMKPMPNGAVPTGAPSKLSTTTPTDLESVGGRGGFTGGAGAAVGAGIGAGFAAGTSSTTGGGRGSDAAGGGVSGGGYGTYTGSNIGEFGRSDMIYNPGGRGPAGEIVEADLWQNSVSKWQVNLGTAALSALATSLGVPGILTMGFRAASNKYGLDAANNFVATANRELMAKAGGYDLSTPEGRQGAATLIDFGPMSNTAASAGVTGSGGRAAEASRTVADQLRDTGLTDAQIGAAAQQAADAVVRGQSMFDAINNAINTAKPDFGVRLSDTDPLYPEGSLYNGDQSYEAASQRNDFIRLSDIDYGSMYNFSKDIGFDWSTMGDFSGGGSFGGKNDFSDIDMV